MTRNEIREKRLQDQLRKHKLSASDILFEMAMRTGHIGLHSLSIAVRYPENENALER